MSDTNTGECRICHNLTDVIQGICSNCFEENKAIRAKVEEEKKIEKKKSDVPKMLKNPDFTNLKSLAKDYMEFIQCDNFHTDNDFHTYLSEEVMTTLFGPKFWDWYNERNP